MKEEPAFPDCAYPDDCECLKRGYLHETGHCLAPEVANVAGLLGLDPDKLFGGKPAPKPDLEEKNGLWALYDGPRKVEVVLHDALSRCTADWPLAEFTPDEVRRIIREIGITSGLRAEAGYSGGATRTLAVATASKDGGGEVRAYLVLADFAGATVGWYVALDGGSRDSECFATWAAARKRLAELAGRSPDEFRFERFGAQTDAELDALDRLA